MKMPARAIEVPDDLAALLLESEQKKQAAHAIWSSQCEYQDTLLKGFMADKKPGAGQAVKFSPDFKLVLIFEGAAVGAS